NLEEPIPLTLSGVSDLSVGFVHTCALTSAGFLCWGLGVTPSQIYEISPIFMNLGASIERLRAGPGAYGRCAILGAPHENRLRCWDFFGSVPGLPELGAPNDLGSAPLIELGGPVLDVQVGSSHVCAL